MRAIEELLAEHRLIWQVFNAVEAPLRVMELKGVVARELLEQLLEFATQYCDRYHHVREEDLLIGRLHEARLVEKGGAADLVLQEHRMARYRLDRLRELLPVAAAGDRQAHGELVKTLRSYTSLLRCHIGMEDRLFFPQAERALSQSARAALEQEFADMAAAGGHELAMRYEALGERLIEECESWAAQAAAQPIGPG